MMRSLKDSTTSIVHNPGTSNIIESIHTNTGGNIKSLSFTPKVEFPRFDGIGTKNWIKKCAKYFSLCKISENQRVDLASLIRLMFRFPII